MKDNFSEQSSKYRKFRPQYPEEVYTQIRSNLRNYGEAWDCGTGNGQVAAVLAEFFARVEATDISKNQLYEAIKKQNINYSLQPAESTKFKRNQFDLIISAQAVHWFNFHKFYAEVERCLKPDGVLVIMGYGLFSSNAATNHIIHQFYHEMVGPYWDEERKYLEKNYETIPFPFREIKTPKLSMEYTWKIEQLLGYLRTWSSVKHYKAEHCKDPVSLIEDSLYTSFGQENTVSFPILFRMGKKEHPAP